MHEQLVNPVAFFSVLIAFGILLVLAILNLDLPDPPKRDDGNIPLFPPW